MRFLGHAFLRLDVVVRTTSKAHLHAVEDPVRCENIPTIVRISALTQSKCGNVGSVRNISLHRRVLPTGTEHSRTVVVRFLRPSPNTSSATPWPVSAWTLS